jgi:hypothetical protein
MAACSLILLLYKPEKKNSQKSVSQCVVLMIQGLFRLLFIAGCYMTQGKFL